jgi:hypothetical protein
VTVARVRGVTAPATVGLPDRTYLAAGSSDGSVHVWDPIDAQVQLKIPLNIAVTALTALGADLAVGTAQGVVVLSPEWDMLASRGIQERAGREGAVANALTHVGRWRATRSIRGLLRRVPPGR